MSKRYCIIMAGGVGSRFWPLSKNNYPKQFLDIFGTGKSFIRSTFERFLPLVPAENFLVVTNASYKDMVLEHLPELKPEQVLCEPMRRNTAPCIAYAAYNIQSKCNTASIIVTPSDHLVTNEIEFQRIADLGLSFVEKPENTNNLITIGIQPSRPETGYGYIKADSNSQENILKVDQFTEKPNLPTAQRFLQEGNYFWNSGIFIWSLQGIMNSFKEFIPELVNVFDRGISKFGTPQEQEFINQNFEHCPNISIDYGVMEKSSNTYVIPAEFGWSDIGTWGSLFAHAQKDKNNNAVNGNAILVNTSNTVVNLDPKIEAIVQGMDNCLVAFRNNSLLVCHLEEEQHIKEWVEKL